MESWRQYGDVVRYRYYGPYEGYLISQPAHIKYVLQDNSHNYHKTPLEMRRFREVLGNGLFTSEGDEWLQQRRTLQPGFHRQRIQSFATIMTDATEDMTRRWAQARRRDEFLDVMPEMRRLVMIIVARSMFGAHLDTEIDHLGRSVLILLEWINRRLYWLFDPIGDIPGPPRQRFERAMAEVNATVQRFIDQSRASQEQRDDLLSMLLEVRDPETGQGLSDTEIREQVMTVFLAGTDTTVNLLGWTWYLLSQHPESARRVCADLASVLNGRTATVEDLPKLTYLTMVLDEVLRLYPPAWAMSRTPIEDDAIGGYRVRANQPVYMCQWVTHRHPEFWDNPEGFDPERFLPERAANRPRFAYFPFGGGARQCIGNTFALMEAQLVVATVLQRFALDLAPGARVTPKPVIGLRPHPGLPMRLRNIK
jgi:cytochrome P450